MASPVPLRIIRAMATKEMVYAAKE
jgi:hypothetical protein